MPFKNILNKMYAKDTSKKVKSAIQSRMREGTYIVLKIAEKIDKDKVDGRRDKTQRLNLDREKLKDLDKAFEKLYEDSLNENITERNFNLMNDKLSKKQNQLLDEINLLEE